MYTEQTQTLSLLTDHQWERFVKHTQDNPQTPIRLVCTYRADNTHIWMLWQGPVKYSTFLALL